MEGPLKPLKRCKELVPLSKEHHQGLLFGWKIKQGLRNATDVKTIAQFIQWFWENDLHDHFRKEEEILAPHLPKGSELVQQMFREHEEIEALVHVNALIPDEDIFRQLADSLYDHIRFEERKLFPYAEEIIPAAEMEKIHQALLVVKEKGKWENEFWLRKR
jgi:hemerythrin-like domain-containing protein